MFTISYAHLNMIHCGGKYLRKWVPYHFGWIKWSLGFKLGGLHDYSLTPGSSFIKPSSNQPKAATVKLAQKPPDIEEIDDKGNEMMNLSMSQKKIVYILTTSILFGEGWKHFTTMAGSQVTFYISTHSCTSTRYNLMMEVLITFSPGISTTLK